MSKVLRAEVDFVALDGNGCRIDIAEYVFKNTYNEDMTEKKYRTFYVQDDDFSAMTDDEFKNFVNDNKRTIAERACACAEHFEPGCLDFVCVTDVSFEYVDID